MMILKSKSMLSPVGQEFNKNTCRNTNLSLNDDEVLTMREKLCRLYADKKVIVAPSTSKLYFSNAHKHVDSFGKMAPEWIYYATGVIALIYDSCELQLALFEKSSIKLLWNLSWEPHIYFSSPTPNFHVINLDSNFTQHVGMLHENDAVADLIMTSFKIICTQMKKSIVQQEPCRSINKNKSSSPLILHFLKSKQSGLTENCQQKTLIKQEISASEQCSVLKIKSDDLYSDKQPLEVKKHYQDSEVTETNNLPSKFTRADSFRNASQLCMKAENASISCEEKKKLKNPLERENSLIKKLFKKKIISRSQSLQNKRCSQITPVFQESEKAKKDNDANEYQRSNRLIKSRASTDSSLVCGNPVKCVLETGQMAKKTRENKHWVRDKSLLSTDLCVTEL